MIATRSGSLRRLLTRAMLVVLAAGAGRVVASECNGAEMKLVPPLLSDNDEYGHSVGVSGDVVVVGSRFDDTSGTLAGAIYAYRYDEATKSWGTPVKLTPGSAGDEVGFSVAASGNVIVAGARRDRDNGLNAGAVYVYRYDLLEMSWGEPAKLAPGAANDQVGFSVAVSGDVVVAGAKYDDTAGSNAGAAWVYRYDHQSRSWGTPDRLTPGVGFDLVGWSVAVDGDVLVAGAPLDDDGGPSAGAAWIYRYGANTKSWGTPVKLAPGTDFDEFGHSVAVSGDVVVVGARRDDDSGEDAGATYVYRYDPKSMQWGEPEKFTPASAFDDFGWSVGVSGDTMIVGAYSDAVNGLDAGAAYVYDYDAKLEVWGPPTVLRPAAAGDQFAFSVSISEGVMAVGARFDDESGSRAGATYVYGCPNVPLLADLDGDGRVTFGDLVILLGQWGPCGGCPADFDGDGAVTFTDLLILLANWG